MVKKVSHQKTTLLILILQLVNDYAALTLCYVRSIFVLFLQRGHQERKFMLKLKGCVK